MSTTVPWPITKVRTVVDLPPSSSLIMYIFSCIFNYFILLSPHYFSIQVAIG